MMPRLPRPPGGVVATTAPCCSSLVASDISVSNFLSLPVSFVRHFLFRPFLLGQDWNHSYASQLDAAAGVRRSPAFERHHAIHHFGTSSGPHIVCDDYILFM